MSYKTELTFFFSFQMILSLNIGLVVQKGHLAEFGYVLNKKGENCIRDVLLYSF